MYKMRFCAMRSTGFPKNCEMQQYNTVFHDASKLKRSVNFQRRLFRLTFHVNYDMPVRSWATIDFSLPQGALIPLFFN